MMTLVSSDPQDTPSPPAPVDASEASGGDARSSRSPGLLRLLVRAVTAAVLVILLAIAAAAIVVPALTGSTTLTVLTSSMEPHLPPGTMVVVRPTKVADIEPGMVVTYQLESGKPLLVTHRVVQRLMDAEGKPLFITQGDANPQPDPTPVREVQIRGTVWYAIPYLGWVANAIGGDVRTILVAVAVIGLLGYAVWMFGSALLGARKRAGSRSTSDDAAS